jgi:Mrp family chromosome partitioning ATPase
VLVASLHKTAQTKLQATVKELEAKSLPILGIIANRQKGAEPVLRATISQSNYVDYFPDLNSEAAITSFATSENPDELETNPQQKEESLF